MLLLLLQTAGIASGAVMLSAEVLAFVVDAIGWDLAVVVDVVGRDPRYCC